MSVKTKTLRALAFAIPVAIGILVFLFLVKTKSAPPKREQPKIARQVRIINIEKADLLPRTKAYGSVQPAKTWQAVPQVKGKIQWIHPQLKKGGRVKKDDVIIKIDPTEYQLSIAQAEANIQNLDAQIGKLRITEANSRALLKIEKNNLELRKVELDREKKLVASQMSAKSVYEKEQQNYYSQQYKVQSLVNNLNTIPSDKKLLNSQMKQSHLQLESAKLQLGYTILRAPFGGVVAKSNVEQWQYIQPGQVVAEIEAINLMEIEIQLTDGRHLFFASRDRISQFRSNRDSKTMGEILEISAVVRPDGGNSPSELPGKLIRSTANIDQQTRTPGVVIQVRNDPSKPAQSGPPFLIKGMYCEVELTGKIQKDLIMVPNNAVHTNNTVYILNKENRLEKRQIDIWFTQESLTIIKSGLSPGEKLIVTDIVPAVDGMLLEPTLDTELMNSLATQAVRGDR